MSDDLTFNRTDLSSGLRNGYETQIDSDNSKICLTIGQNMLLSSIDKLGSSNQCDQIGRFFALLETF